MRNTFLFILLCSLFLNLNAQVTVMTELTASNEISSKFEKARKIMEAYSGKGITGMILQVNDQSNQWEYATGFSDLQHKKPMQVEDRLMVASITKMFLASTVLKLSEKNQLDLDKPIRDFSCGDHFKDIPNTDRITIRHLLQHTSGLPDFLKQPQFAMQLFDHPTLSRTKRDLIRYLIKVKPDFAPGTSARYSNTNYMLLAFILDEEFREQGGNQGLMCREIIEPLGLKATQYVDRRNISRLVTKGYVDLHRDGRFIDVTSWATSNAGSGYSGLISTVSDLSVFLHALLIQKTVLNESSLQQMLCFIPDDEEKEMVSFGLGIWKDFRNLGEEQSALGHRGRELGFTADLFYFPESNISYVLLANCGMGFSTETEKNFKSMRQELAELLARK